MRIFLLGFATAIFLPIFSVVVLFSILPKLETWHDAYSSIPGFIVRYPIILAARGGDYPQAAATLNRQANLAELLGINDYMRRDLVENTRYIMDRARYDYHYTAMQQWLDRLEQIAKNNYLAKLLAAEARAYTNPKNAEQFMSTIRKAAPSYDRAYRPVLESNLRGANDDMVATACRQYAVAQASAFSMFEFLQVTFQGQNVGNLFLELRDRANDTIMLPHEGFKLNERRQYTFEFGDQPEQDLIRVHVPSLPGLKIVTHGLSFNSNRGARRFNPNELKIVSRNGYFVDAKTSIITSFRGDILSYAPQKGRFPASEAITFDLEIRRLPLSNHQVCLKLINGG